jgi:hypothetical protein
MRFEALMAVKMMMFFFRVLTPYLPISLHSIKALNNNSIIQLLMVQVI